MFGKRITVCSVPEISISVRQYRKKCFENSDKTADTVGEKGDTSKGERTAKSMKKAASAPLTFAYEDSFAPRIVCGTDEAGRGPLAGRVYAAAVILPEEIRNEPFVAALNDSKKLSAKRREALAEEIKKFAPYAVAYSEVAEIEKLNILEASLLAMRRAIAALPIAPDVALIDGNICRNFPIEAHAIIGGDGLSPSIAAASILAKIERDRYCIEVLDKQYPEYGFAVHKGYGTKAHYEALRKYGACEAHRMSFLKKFTESDGEKK